MISISPFILNVLFHHPARFFISCFTVSILGVCHNMYPRRQKYSVEAHLSDRIYRGVNQAMSSVRI
jgi:hypothetical protein